jgi:hypothetical protein
VRAGVGCADDRPAAAPGLGARHPVGPARLGDRAHEEGLQLIGAHDVEKGLERRDTALARELADVAAAVGGGGVGERLRDDPVVPFGDLGESALGLDGTGREPLAHGRIAEGTQPLVDGQRQYARPPGQRVEHEAGEEREPLREGIGMLRATTLPPRSRA